MQRSPALVVPPVDVAATLHQKLHHLGIFINASLPDTGDAMKTLFRAQITVPFQHLVELTASGAAAAHIYYRRRRHVG